jgi:hypothetical protein
MVMYVFLRKDKKIVRFHNFLSTIMYSQSHTKTLEVFSEVILHNRIWFLLWIKDE